MGSASVPKRSTIRSDGGCFMERREERREGNDSIMVKAIRFTKEGFGPSLFERSWGGGITTKFRAVRLLVCWRIWEHAVEGSVVTRKMVTSKPWWMRRRFPSSTVGMRCPMPGLASRAA